MFLPAFLWILLCAAPFPFSPFPSKACASVFYPASYYPDSADSLGATPIHLEPGETSAPLRLGPRSAGGSVTIRILGDDDGLPIEGVLVEAVVGRFRAYAKTDAGGHAVVTGARPGMARVSARPDDPRSETGAYAVGSSPTLLEIRDGAESDAGEIRLARAGRIKALVRRPTGQAWPSIPVVLKAVDDSFRRIVRTAEDGRASFGGLSPGAYRLWADATGTDAVSEAWDGSRDTLSSTPLEVLPGSLLSPVEIRPDLGGTISGVVRDKSASLGLPDVEVHIVAQQVPRNTYTFRTDPLGFYFATGLAGGSYKIYVPILLRWYPDATSESAGRPVTATEGATAFGIDLAGDPIAECTIATGRACAVNGAIRANFDIMPSATVVVWNDADTIQQVVREAGSYTVGCIPPGSYRVKCVPEGTYRTQYHKKTNAPDSAVVVTIAAGDTARAVDFEPQRSVVIEGSVEDGETGLPLEGIRVTGSRSGGDRVQTITDAAGGFLLDRFPDGSGLPTGDWIVGTDSISITDIAPTPVRTIDLAAARTGPSVRIRFLVPEDLAIGDWFLERRCGEATMTIVADASRHPDGTRAREFTDSDAAGGCVYRLSVDLGPEAAGGRIESRWVSAGIATRSLFPSPWDGRGVLHLPEPVRPGGRCALLTPDGSHTLQLQADGLEISLPSGVAIASGVYFLRWRTVSGNERTARIVVKR